MSRINKYYYDFGIKRGRAVAKEAPLGSVLQLYFQRYHIPINPYDNRIKEEFNRLVGKMIQKYITNINIKNKVLYVYTCSPAVRAELSMLCDALVVQINRSIETEALEKIIIR